MLGQHGLGMYCRTPDTDALHGVRPFHLVGQQLWEGTSVATSYERCARIHVDWRRQHHTTALGVFSAEAMMQTVDGPFPKGRSSNTALAQEPGVKKVRQTIRMSANGPLANTLQKCAALAARMRAMTVGTSAAIMTCASNVRSSAGTADLPSVLTVKLCIPSASRSGVTYA